MRRRPSRDERGVALSSPVALLSRHRRRDGRHRVRRHRRPRPGAGRGGRPAGHRSAAPTPPRDAPRPRRSSTEEAGSKQEAGRARATTYVEVYNNSGITGLAGSVAARAQGAGWQVVGSDNWYGTIPASTVYYPPRLKAAAEGAGHRPRHHAGQPGRRPDARRPAHGHPHRRLRLSRPAGLTAAPATVAALVGWAHGVPHRARASSGTPHWCASPRPRRRPGLRRHAVADRRGPGAGAHPPRRLRGAGRPGRPGAGRRGDHRPAGPAGARPRRPRGGRQRARRRRAGLPCSASTATSAGTPTDRAGDLAREPPRGLRGVPRRAAPAAARRRRRRTPTSRRRGSRSRCTPAGCRTRRRPSSGCCRRWRERRRAPRARPSSPAAT